jgi:hypothetical protein
MLKVELCLAARNKKDDKILLRQRVEHSRLTEAVIIDGHPAIFCMGDQCQLGCCFLLGN